MKNIFFILIINLFTNITYCQTGHGLSDTEKEQQCSALPTKDEQNFCFVELYSDDKIQTEYAAAFRKEFHRAIEHHKMLKLESTCMVKDGKKTGMIFYNKSCLTPKEVVNIKYEDSKYAPKQLALEKELGDCPNTKDKLRRTAPRFLNNSLIARIKKDCLNETNLSNNSERNMENISDSYSPNTVVPTKANTKNK